MIPLILAASADETILDDHLRLLHARQLETAEYGIKGEPYAGYRELVETLLKLADATVPEDAPAFLPPQGGLPSDWTARAGSPGFILAHAPIEPRGNQVLLARAATRACWPLVLAGPVRNREYAAHVRAFAGERVVFLPEPPAAARAGLYAHARVYVDIAWRSEGRARRALAAATGCKLVLSPEVDPSDEDGITRAIQCAWDAPPPPEPLPPGDPLPAVIEAYALASGAAARRT